MNNMNEKNPETANQGMILATATTAALSRRELLQVAGSAAALVMLASGGQSAAAQSSDSPRSVGGSRYLQATTDKTKQQFPYFTDGPWDQPQYYETIQAGGRLFPKTRMNADIDGDGRDEMIARGPGGVHVNRYDSNTGQWVPMTEPTHVDGGKLWRDDYGWDQSQYYSTIQCADIDGDGQAELIGRGGQGLEAYKYDKTANNWIALPILTAWSDANTWNQPQYYSTIQCADIDGDGQAELIGRSGQGLEIYKLDTPAAPKAWQRLPLPIAHGVGLWGNDNGWAQPQYYLTIQCADIDGDGQAELIGRGGQGLEIYKYDASLPAQGYLKPFPIQSAWSDSNHWDQVQFYSTIQTARVLKFGTPAVPGDAAEFTDPGYIGDGIHTQSVIIGRGSDGMQTWRCVSPAVGCVQTSALLPEWTASQKDAYSKIGIRLNDPLANNIRAHYNNEAFLGANGRFSKWQGDLYNNPSPGSYNQAIRPHCALQPPAGVSRADWDSVTWLIYWELQWVQNVYEWYGSNQAGGLLDRNVIEQFLTLQKVGDYLAIPDDSTEEVVFTILALLAGIAAAILSGGAALAVESAVGLGLGISAAVAGGLATAFRAVPGLLPAQGGPFTMAYKDLQATIDSSFTAALRGNEIMKFNLTGGTSAGMYFPPDYGRLKQIGEWVEDGTWQWLTDPNGSPTSEYVIAAAQGYAIYCWKRLLTVQPWHVWDDTYVRIPGDYPKQYLYHRNGAEYVLNLWRHVQSLTPREAMAALFDPHQAGSTFPLAVPLADVFEGKHGWPKTEITDGLFTPLPSDDPPLLPIVSLGVDLHLSVGLSRDEVTGEVMAQVTIENRGMSPATNVEITGGSLSMRHILANYSLHQTRVLPGYPMTMVLGFPNILKGTKTILRVSGRYLGGTFGGSFRVTLP